MGDTAVLGLTFEGNGTINSNYADNGSNGVVKFIMGNENTVTGSSYTVNFAGSFSLQSRRNIFTFNADNFTFAKNNGGGFAPNFSTDKNHEINFNANNGVLSLTNGMQVSGSGSLSTSSTASIKNISNTINNSYTVSGGTNTLNFTGTSQYGATLNIGASGASAFTLSGGTNNINIKGGGSHTLKASAFTLSGGTNNITFADTVTESNTSGATSLFKIETTGLSIGSGVTNNVAFNNAAGSTLDLNNQNYTVNGGTNTINSTAGSNTINSMSYLASGGTNTIGVQNSTLIFSNTLSYTAGRNTINLSGGILKVGANGDQAYTINGSGITNQINVTFGENTLNSNFTLTQGTNTIAFTSGAQPSSLALKNGSDKLAFAVNNNAVSNIIFNNTSGSTLDLASIDITGSGSNAITVSSENNTITGSISIANTSGNGNTLNFSGGTLTISNGLTLDGADTAATKNTINITANSNILDTAWTLTKGTNTIAFNSSSGSASLTLNTSGTTTDFTVGNDVANNIEFKGSAGGTLTLKSFTLNGANATNTFSITDGSNNTVSASDGWTFTQGINTFTFDSSNASSLTIQAENKHNPEFTFGANVTNNINFNGAGGGTLSLHDEDGRGIIKITDGTQNITVSAGSNTINGAISITSGTNNINFTGASSLAISEGITLSGGSSTIEVSQNIAGTLATGFQVTNGTNTINLNKGSSITLGVIQDPQQFGSQGLAISGGNTTINFNNNADTDATTAAAIKGYVSIAGGTNTINLNGTGGTQGSNVVSNIQSFVFLTGGTNTINFTQDYQTLTAPKAIAGHEVGVVTSGAGTTLNINFGKPADLSASQPATATTGGILSANLVSYNGGKNIVNVGSDGNAIDGTITAEDGGSNVIKFYQDNLVLDFSGNLTANQSGQNYIEGTAGVNNISFTGTLITAGNNVTFGVGGNYFEINNNQTLSFETLRAGSGVNRIRFNETSGTLKGDTFGVVNTTAGDNDGINRFVFGTDTQDSPYAGNGTYTISKNNNDSVIFDAQQFGINAFMIHSGNTTINTFSPQNGAAQLVFTGANVGDALLNQDGTTTNFGNVFRLANNANLSILDDASNKAALDTQSGKTIFFLEGTSATLKADIYANKAGTDDTMTGENIFRFSQANSTLNLSDSTITANKNAKNIFEISQDNTIITSDTSNLVLSGTVADTESGANIISFISDKTDLTIGNGGGTVGNIQTTDGLTQIEFSANGSTLNSNLVTTKGITQIHLNSAGTQGNNTLNTLNGTIQTNATGVDATAKTEIIFNANNATLALSQATFTATNTDDINSIQSAGTGALIQLGAGGNTLTLAGAGHNNITIDGSALGNGARATLGVLASDGVTRASISATQGATSIVLNNGELTSDFIVSDATNTITATGTSIIAGDLTLNGTGSNTIDFGADDATLTLNSFTVTNGTSNINFAQNNTNLAGDIILKGGSTTITASKVGTDANTIATNTISGDLNIQGGTNAINLNASNSELNITGALRITGGNNTINFDQSTPTGVTNATLQVSNLETGGTTATTTTINFYGSNNVLDGNVTALSNGTNKIIVKGSGNTITGNILADSGANIIDFQNNDLSLDFGGILTALNGGTNTVKASNGANGMTFVSDTQVTGDNNSASKNIFVVGANQTLSFKDANNNSLKTLSALGGVAEVQMKTNSTGFSGNLEANGGNTKVTFESAGNYDLNGELKATNGDNTIELASGDTTLKTNGITLSGENGRNIINATTANQFTLHDQNSKVTGFTTTSGETIINLANTTFTSNIATSGGTTTIEVGGANDKFIGTIQALASVDGSSIGKNIIDLDTEAKNGMALDISQVTLQTQDNAVNVFVLKNNPASSSTLSAILKVEDTAGLALSGNNTEFAITNSTLNINKVSGGSGAISVGSDATSLFTLQGTSTQVATLAADSITIQDGGVNTFAIQGNSYINADIAINDNGTNIIAFSNNAPLTLKSLTLNGVGAINKVAINSAGNYSLSGTLTLTKGTSIIEFDNKSQSATFTSSNITTSADLSSQISFNSDNATLKANIDVAAGVNTVSLNQSGSTNNKIDGDFKISGGENYFKLGGGVLNLGKFEMSGGSNIVEIIQGGRSVINASSISLTGGTNTITFTPQASGAIAAFYTDPKNSTTQGYIVADGQFVNIVNFNGGGATLYNPIKVVASGSNTINVASNSSQANTILGGIQVSGGTNTINFENGGTLILGGNFPANNQTLSTALTTTGGESIINFKGTGSNLGGDVIANGSNGKNTINVYGNGNQISGTILAQNGGSNTITFKNSNLALAFSGSLTAIGAGSTNTVSLDPSSSVATFSDMTVVASDNGSNIFQINSNQTLKFFGAGGKKTLSATTLSSASTLRASTSSTIGAVVEFVGLSGSFIGNVEANGADTRIRFANNNGAYDIDSVLIATNGTNTLLADKTSTTLNGSIATQGGADGENIIQVSADSSLYLTSLNTQSGSTTLSLASGSLYSGKIATSGGELTFDTSSASASKQASIIGLISASKEGVNTLTSANIANLNLKDASFSASQSGKNIFNLSGTTTFVNALSLNGEDVNSDGGNIFDLAASSTLKATAINTQSGVTRFNLAGNATIDAPLSVSGNNNASNPQAGYQEINLNNNTLTLSQSAITVGNNGVSILNTGASSSASAIIAKDGLSFDMGVFAQSIINLDGELSIKSNSSTLAALAFNGGNAIINAKGKAILGVSSISTSANTKINILGDNSSFESSSLTSTANTTFILNGASQTLTLKSLSASGSGSNLIDIYSSNATINITQINNNAGLTLRDNATLVLNASQKLSATLNASGSNTALLNALSLGESDVLNVNVKKDASIKFEKSLSGGAINFNLAQNSQTILGDSSSLDQVSFTANNALLFLQGSNTTIDALSNSNVNFSQNFVSLAGSNASTLNRINTLENRADLRNLTINNLSGENINFVVYANSNGADKITINGGSNVASQDANYTLSVAFADNVNINSYIYNENFNSTGTSNVAVAQVANNSNVKFNSTSNQVLGFDVVAVDFITKDDGNTTTYYLGQAVSEGVIGADQQAAATAVGINYDLYLANFNSLNKRMGELRENAHSQGVWARVFSGAQSNSYGLGSKSNYTTIQAGYDYAFGSEGANNYLGFALSYALSTSSVDNVASSEFNQVRDVNSIKSSAVEVALYNSYVSDSGWYNDSIAKFSYLMSSFDIEDVNSQNTLSSDTTNYAITVSDEVGYRFNAGSNKEWSITPQVEVAFGYFNQSDFSQSLGAYSLDTTAENLLTLRTRAGVSLGYDFKSFTQNSGFNASVYVGTYYEYDYMNGGNLDFTTNFSNTNRSSDMNTDDRVVLNVGTNMTVKDNTRIYFDFEKSFDGKITTDYQVNVGVRYSFGESNGYTPLGEKAEFKAPLKVEEDNKEENKEEEQKQEDKSEEKGEGNKE